MGGFGFVDIQTHEPILDGSKVPLDGRAPLGIGEMWESRRRRVISYDCERVSQRSGVQHVAVDDRMSTLACSSAPEVIEETEAELKPIALKVRQRLGICSFSDRVGAVLRTMVLCASLFVHSPNCRRARRAPPRRM